MTGFTNSKLLPQRMPALNSPKQNMHAPPKQNSHTVPLQLVYPNMHKARSFPGHQPQILDLSTFGSKSGSQNGPKQRSKEGMKCDPILDPFWGPYLDQKWVSHRRISLLPVHVVQADLRPCSFNMSVNSYLFLFVRPKSGCYCQGPLSQPYFDTFSALFWP